VGLFIGNMAPLAWPAWDQHVVGVVDVNDKWGKNEGAAIVVGKESASWPSLSMGPY
jgi:hypothetical protein